MGVWVETTENSSMVFFISAKHSLMGMWIETVLTIIRIISTSHSVWVCGLKCDRSAVTSHTGVWFERGKVGLMVSHTLYECVD